MIVDEGNKWKVHVHVHVHVYLHMYCTCTCVSTRVHMYSVHGSNQLEGLPAVF